MVENAKIPKPEELPPAPEKFDMVSDAEARLPLPPQYKSTQGFDMSDPGMQPTNNLPKISDLPDGWSLIVTQFMEKTLEINVSLPVLWERVSGKRVEKVIVEHSTSIVESRGLIPCNMCYAMRDSDANAFASWVGAQVFVKSSKGLYVECSVEIHDTAIDGKVYRLLCLIPLTPAYTLSVFCNILPIATHLSEASPELIARSKAALLDPTNILSTIKLEDRQCQS